MTVFCTYCRCRATKTVRNRQGGSRNVCAAHAPGTPGARHAARLEQWARRIEGYDSYSHLLEQVGKWVCVDRRALYGEWPRAVTRAGAEAMIRAAAHERIEWMYSEWVRIARAAGGAAPYRVGATRKAVRRVESRARCTAGS